MLFGKLYAMLIYGIEGSKGRSLPGYLASLITSIIIVWVSLVFVSVVQLKEEPNFLNTLLMIAIIVSVPLITFFVGRWGRKKAKQE